MDLEDIAAGKCRALHDRRDANDYVDAAFLLVHPGWDFERLYGCAKSALPNLSRDEFRGLLRSVDSLTDRDLASTGMSVTFVRGILGRV